MKIKIKSGCIALALLLSGCNRDDVQVYRVPKETPVVEEASHEGHTHGQEQSAATPRVQWTLPSGWQEQPASGMRVGSFVIAGPEGKKAEVSIIPLPATGQEVDLVNMWRGQVQLGPVSAEDIGKQSEGVTVGGEKGKMFDIASNETNAPLGLLVAMVRKDDKEWFFKMTGDRGVVREQKAAFVSFLGSIKFEASSPGLELTKAQRAMSTNTKLAPKENSERPVWVVPPGWKEVPGGQMLVAKFVIGDESAKAELNISQLSGTGGGVLANVNRWRNQLGLAPLNEGDLTQQVRSFDVPGGKAMLVDMSGNDPKTGQKARLLGAIVPQSEQSWFYKLMGNEQVIEREREVFTRFLKTTTYSNVP